MATSKKGKTADDEPTLVRVQHAVVIKTAADIRALNDLLSVGWRTASTSALGDAVLVILERAGSQEDIEEMRAALGYSTLTGENTDACAALSGFARGLP